MALHDRGTVVTKRERSSYLDNAKALLIVLVVLGHVMAPLRSSEFGAGLYLMIYSFHMPAFAAVTGYLSRPDVATPRGRSRFLRLFGVFVVFQALHTLLRTWISGEFDLERAFEYPEFTLWWILALLYWTLLLPLFSETKSTTEALQGLAAAVLLAVVSGFVLQDGTSYSLGRTFVFLPFFVGGYYAARHEWSVPRHKGLAVGAVALMVAVVVMFARLDFLTWQEWLQGRFTFSRFGLAWWHAASVRLGVLGLSAVMIVALAQLVPRRETWFSGLGRSTLSVYLWHAVLVTVLTQRELLGVVAGDWFRAVALTAAIVAVTGFGPLAEGTVRFLGGKKPMPNRDPDRVRAGGIVAGSPDATSASVGRSAEG